MNKEKTKLTAKDRKELTEAIKLSDEVCGTCNNGRKKEKGDKYMCTLGKGNKYAFDNCEDGYKRNVWL